MKRFIRTCLWKVLGIDYYHFLKNQKKVYLSEFRGCTIGENSYDNGAVVWRWLPEARLTIGKYCSLAHGVELFLDSGFHNSGMVTTFPLFSELYKYLPRDQKIGDGWTKEQFFAHVTKKTSIQIANDVWIGTNAMIMPGISIADGAIILPGSVVSSDIGPYQIFGGVPARKINQRFDDDIIRELLQIKWWDWEESLIRKRIDDFYGNPSEFVKKYSRLCISVT